MDKKKIVKLAVGAVVVALAVGTGAGFFLGHNEPLQPTVIKPIPADKVADPSIWGENYPAQYASFLKNDTDKGKLQVFWNDEERSDDSYAESVEYDPYTGAIVKTEIMHEHKGLI